VGAGGLDCGLYSPGLQLAVRKTPDPGGDRVTGLGEVTRIHRQIYRGPR